MYLRFVIPMKDSDSGVEQGAFQAAYRARRAGGLCAHERQELDDLLDWFADNLEAPVRFNRTKSRGYYRRATKGVCWFKPSARQHLARMHRMAAILRNQGYHVTMTKTRKPGYLIYEDEHQVVAEPFRDLRV